MKKNLRIFWLSLLSAASMAMHRPHSPDPTGEVILPYEESTYYSKDQDGKLVEPDDLILVSHGGKFEYIQKWLHGAKGYNLEITSDAHYSRGIQVTPLFRLEDKRQLVSKVYMKRAAEYAQKKHLHRPLTPEQQKEWEEGHPVIIYFVIQARYLQRATNDYEAAIRDEVRSHILGWYIITQYDWLQEPWMNPKDLRFEKAPHLRECLRSAAMGRFFLLDQDIPPGGPPQAFLEAVHQLNLERPLENYETFLLHQQHPIPHHGTGHAGAAHAHHVPNP